MGKGDKKSRRGKIILGSYGVRRPRKNSDKPAVGKSVEAAVKAPKEKVIREKKEPRETPQVKEVKEIKETKPVKETKAKTESKEKAEKKEPKEVKPKKDKKN